jgi:hypothetical protein
MSELIARPYEESNSGSNDPQAWHCLSCRRVHLRTGQHLLTFTSEEFAALTESVVACYCSQVVSEILDDSSHDEGSALPSRDEAIN